MRKLSFLSDYWGLIVWFMICCAVLSFFGWTTYLLFLQKKTWKFFAEKHKLQYKNEGLLNSPSVYGNYGNGKINLYSEERLTQDVRGRRFITVIEILTEQKCYFEGAITAGSAVELINFIDMEHILTPQSEMWQSNFSAKTNDYEAMKSFLDEKGGMKVLYPMMKNPKNGFVAVFMNNEFLLRFETSNPIVEIEKLERIVKSMLAITSKTNDIIRQIKTTVQEEDDIDNKKSEDSSENNQAELNEQKNEESELEDK